MFIIGCAARRAHSGRLAKAYATPRGGESHKFSAGSSHSPGKSCSAVWHSMTSCLHSGGKSSDGKIMHLQLRARVRGAMFGEWHREEVTPGRKRA
jgi:hypothetical protein